MPAMMHARTHTISSALALAALLATTGLTGCVQRTITINSDPQGALVFLNDTEVGRTPVTVPFTFYGDYEVRLERDGYATLNTNERTMAPWWENPGPDLLAEAIPNNRVDLQWFYALEELGPVDAASLVRRADQLRNQLGQPVGSPLQPLPPAPTHEAPTEPESPSEPEK